MKILIYTAVFGKYDKVYSPVQIDGGIDHIIITDDGGLNVPGWTIMVVDSSIFPTLKAANLYYRALIHRVLPDYDASLYVDGNIRLLGETAPLFEELEKNGAALAAYPHPLRSTVAEELEAVLALGRTRNPEAARGELRGYLAQGFPDTIRLIETGVMLRDHRAAEFDPAMELWWSLFREYQTRDQLSLPYVIWKTGLRVHLMEGSFRHPNPFFGLYPHVGEKGVNPRYADAAARSYSSRWFRFVRSLWDGYRWLGRAARAYRS